MLYSYFSILLHCMSFWSFCAVYVQRRSLFFLRIPLHYKFRPNWPSSGVQVFMVKDLLLTEIRVSFSYCNFLWLF
jgi:hypothetical protein